MSEIEIANVLSLGLFAGWGFEQCLEFNATAYPDDCFAVEKIDRAIRPQFSFDSAFYAVLSRWRVIGLRIFYEIMALEIRYHSKSIATPPLDNASPNVLDGSVSNVATAASWTEPCRRTFSTGDAF